MPDNHTTNALGSDMSFPHAYGELVNQDGVIQAVDSPRGMGFDPNPQQKSFYRRLLEGDRFCPGENRVAEMILCP